MSEWISCDTPPDNGREVFLTTCEANDEANRTVHPNSQFKFNSWWHFLGSRIQEIPVSWKESVLPEPDHVTAANPEARIAEIDVSCAIIRGERPNTNE